MKTLFGFILTGLLVIIAINSSAQFKENFEDENFSANPQWMGDTAKFKVIAGKLQSQSLGINDKFYISTVSKSTVNTQWEFLINLQFNTSSANYVDVFLTSDSANLSGNNSGYLIRIGTTSDNISFLKKSGIASTVLIPGKAGSTNHSSNVFKIKVTCDANRNFSLRIDSTGLGTNFISVGSIKDTTFKSSNYFGLVIRQSTASFFNRHFFDDFYVGKIIQDTIKPFVKTVEIKNPDTLLVSFSEKLNLSSLKLLNFDINNTIGNPYSSRFLLSDSSVIELALVNSLAANTLYNFEIKNCRDKAGNFLKDTTFKLKWFQYEKPMQYDIVIHEWMPDPEPRIGLPNQEYIELFNNSNKILQLENCFLGDKSSGTKLPEMVLEPDSFIILCEAGNEALFIAFGKTLGVKDFPSLNNSGDEIYLRNAEGKLIHRVKYDLNSYGDLFKSNGGWALEMMDPNNPCEASNYNASVNSSGGTPGKINSIQKPNPDNQKPYINSVFIKSSTKLWIEFNEPIDSFSAVNLVNYSITDNSIQSIVSFFEIVEINFSQPLLINKIYNLELKKLIDCSSNLINDTTLQIALPEKVLPGDIIINEILFNPSSGGFDFIEVYNRSDKIVSLKNLTLFNFDDNKQPGDLRIIDTSGILILPKQFKVFTTNPSWLIENYKNTVFKSIFPMVSLPSMDDKQGHIGITDGTGTVIDELDYSESMHLPLLTNMEGVSLERISYNVSSIEISNWTSAAASYGFATPGLVNSHHFSVTLELDWLTIEPALFSPDEDGLNDVASFTITSVSQNQQATLIIFDAFGRLITTLVNNALIGNTQTWFWDGTYDGNKKAAIGIYIVYAELFGLDGKRLVKKKTVTVGGK